LEVAQRQGQYERASQLRFATIPELQRQLPSETEFRNKELEDEGKLGGMLHDKVTSDDIAKVVAKATGIPVTNLLKGERDKLVHVSVAVSSPSLLLLPSILMRFIVGADGRHAPPTHSGSG
jgi:ATP-dependent Clp protease ATP-binding subunit ClpB